jgi:hypothetical protein
MHVLSIKRAILVGGAALVLGGAAIGVAGAQHAPSTGTTEPAANPATTAQATQPHTRQQRFLEALAAKLGVTPDRLKQAITEARAEVGLPAHRTGLPYPGAVRPRVRAIRAHELGVAAQAMSISVQQLRQALPGKSLADVAREHGVEPNAVADAMKADAHARIDRAVSNGRYTADRAARIKQRIDARIDRLMTRQIPARLPRS